MTDLIMVVDDELDMEMLITQKFRKQVRSGEFEFIFAYNGLEALAKLIEHPECEEGILNSADYIGSTSGLLKYTFENESKKFIVATEPGIINQMKIKSPDKIFIEAPPESSCSCNECPYMKLNSLQKLFDCMINKTPEIIMGKYFLIL